MFQLYKQIANHLSSYNLLYDAIKTGDVQAVKGFVTRDNINKFLWKTHNSLSLAISENQLGVIIFLLEQGADPTQKQPTLKGQLSILDACIADEEDFSITKLLILYAKDLNTTSLSVEEVLKKQKLQLDGYLKIIEEHNKSATPAYLQMLNAWKNIGDIWWNCCENELNITVKKHYQQKAFQAYYQAAECYRHCQYINNIPLEHLNPYKEIFSRLSKTTSLTVCNKNDFANSIPLHFQ